MTEHLAGLRIRSALGDPALVVLAMAAALFPLATHAEVRRPGQPRDWQATTLS